MLEAPLNPNATRGFKLRRLFIFITICVVDALVYFQRACPSTMGEVMAHSYGVDVQKLSVFSSVFFYPYALLQPFAGLLADVLEPAFLMGSFNLLAAAGAAICGLAKTVPIACVGRFFVGFGSGPIYVPACRTFANWYPLASYPVVTGLFAAIANIGGILGQGPLASLEKIVGWRACFYGVAFFGGACSIVVLFAVRGHPTAFGYNPVNRNLDDAPEGLRVNGVVTVRDRLKLLGANFKTVLKRGDFWIAAFFCALVNGPFFDVLGMWGGPFLTHVYGWDTVKSGNVMVGVSVGSMIGSVVGPLISNALGTRKWVVFAGSIIAMLSTIPFIAIPLRLPFAVVVGLFIIFSMCTNSLSSVLYAMVREYYHANTAATAIGCVNSFAFIGSAIYQPVTGVIMDKFGKVEGTMKYKLDGYKYGLWMLSLVSLAVSAVVILFAKDTEIKPKVTTEEYQAIHEPSIMGIDSEAD